MTKVIAVTQQKGGAGKTTVAVHLGMAWALAGQRVHFIDVDPQQSLSQWHAARIRLGAGGHHAAIEHSGNADLGG
jgi:chromosome partitioning protein